MMKSSRDWMNDSLPQVLVLLFHSIADVRCGEMNDGMATEEAESGIQSGQFSIINDDCCVQVQVVSNNESFFCFDCRH